MPIFPIRWRTWISTCAWAVLLLAVRAPACTPATTATSVGRVKPSHEARWMAAPAGLEDLKAGSRRPGPPRAEGPPLWMAPAGGTAVRPAWNEAGSRPRMPQPAPARQPSLVGTVELRV